MTRLATLLGLLAVLAPAPACGDDDGGGGSPDAGPPGDLLEALRAIPGMTATEVPVDPPYRFFQIEYVQPVDHAAPDGATFHQRITLLHRDPDAPMVLHTTGYYGVDQAFLAELTALVDGNQINVEQRYFVPSRPDPADWSKLTIDQAAGDQHRIVEALRPLYPGAWLGTGASKGGMTSIFHRRFFPDDLTATVAYVAPISFGAPDDRYQPFFDTVGPSQACRDRLEAYQRELLIRRDAMVPRMTSYGQASGLTFDRSSGVDGAFEDSVVEYTWGFWQYGPPVPCSQVPGSGATDDELWSFHADTAWLDFYSDQDISDYEPYFYQSETELGYPSEPTAHIDDLLVTQDDPRDFLPEGITATFDPTAMQDIDEWVKSEGERLLLVYGEWDPWYAGHFDLGDAADSYLYVAPEMNHGAGIGDLTADDQAAVYDELERWTGVTPQDPYSLRRARGLPPEPRPRTRL